MYNQAPVFYRKRAVMPDGIGSAMAETVMRNGDINPLLEIVNRNIMLNWLSLQYDSQLDTAALTALNEKCRRFLRKRQAGFGLERVIYVLADESYCLSPILKTTVSLALKVFYAICNLASQSKLPMNYFDRHITAFLVEKDNAVIDPHYTNLTSGNSQKITLAKIGCLALIQSRYKMAAMPELTEVLSKRLDALYDFFHDAHHVEKLKDKVKKIAKKGVIQELVDVFIDTEIIRRDRADFKNAMTTYSELKDEHRDIESSLNNPEKFNQKYAGEVSIAVCTIISVMIIALSVMSFLFKNESISTLAGL